MSVIVDQNIEERYLTINIMVQRTVNENAACLRRICKRSDQGQRHESPNWKPRIATVDSFFDLVGSRQHGVASYMKYSTGRLISIYSLDADGDDLRWNTNPNFWQLANVTCKTRFISFSMVNLKLGCLDSSTNCSVHIWNWMSML